MNFSSLINEIQNEIGHEYLSGAINYIDKNKNNAWSKAMNELDDILTVAIKSKDHSAVEPAFRKYKTDCIAWIKEYKSSKPKQITENIHEYISDRLK